MGKHLILALSLAGTLCEGANPDLRTKIWSAKWIAVPDSRSFLGSVRSVSGSIRLTKGTIEVNLKLNETGSFNAGIDLPPGVTGAFVWKGQRQALQSRPTGITL